MDIGKEVQAVMLSASPEARALIAHVFQIEKKYQGMSRPGSKLQPDLEKAVRKVVSESRDRSA